jgi:hypothetical protein
MWDFLQQSKSGDLSISAVRGRAGQEVTSSFASLTRIWYGWPFEFFVYLSLFKTYATFSIAIENAL